jgi:large subunit ribosomal protein L5e
MAFVKVVKNKAYFMRYQTKFKRRREGKTDYYARQRLIMQDNDKYNTPKYRLVGRITSTRVIAQVVYATLKGDKVFGAADSQELRKFGLNSGLSNYAAAYATGLLLARRILKKVGLDATYKGVEKVEGQHFDVNNDVKDRRPFKCILDVGLRATSNGSKIFAILKGACDGGLYVPHSPNKYPGAAKKDDEKSDDKVHRGRIFGTHVDTWINKLKNNKVKYDLQFSKWQKTLTDTNSGSIEKLFTKLHDDIRKNPDFKKKAKKENPKRDFTKKIQKRLTNEQRKKNVQTKITIKMKEAQKAAKKKA